MTPGNLCQYLVVDKNQPDRVYQTDYVPNALENLKKIGGSGICYQLLKKFDSKLKTTTVSISAIHLKDDKHKTYAEIKIFSDLVIKDIIKFLQRG